MDSKIKILALAAAGAVLTVLSGCGKSQQAAPPQMPPPSVKVMNAQAKDVPLYLDEIGKILAMESVVITPRIDGQIIERRFENGADIKKDQVLFLIDPAPSQAALAAAQAQVAQAKAAAEFAKIEYDRYAAVAGTSAISKSDIDTRRNAVDVANAQVAAAEAATKTAQINLDFCTIRSPIDGRAGARMVDVGNVVRQNETSLLSIQKLDPIYIDFTVNENELAAVRKNMAEGTLKTYAKLPADQGMGQEGELSFVDNAVQDSSGTVKLRATIANKDAHFWPGQFVNVRLVLATMKDAVLIPNTATQVSQQGLFVFKVTESDKSPTKMAVAQQPVILGQQQGEMVVVTQGVSAGERIVTAGQMMLQDGAPVSIAGEKPAGDAAGQGNATQGEAPKGDAQSGSKS